MMQGLPCSNGNCLPPASPQANLLNSAIDEDNVSGDSDSAFHCDTFDINGLIRSNLSII